MCHLQLQAAAELANQDQGKWRLKRAHQSMVVERQPAHNPPGNPGIGMGLSPVISRLQVRRSVELSQTTMWGIYIYIYIC